VLKEAQKANRRKRMLFGCPRRKKAYATRWSEVGGRATTLQKAGAICDDVPMKKFLIYVPVVLSLVVLGAHFMRYGHSAGVVGSIVLIALLFVRQPWVARLIQIALVLGALEWLWTLFGLVQVRTAMGQPFLRMTVIIGVVAAVTLISALLFQTSALKKIYKLDSHD
jgi:hypothetical protein